MKWFKHYSNASESLKISKLIDEMGAEGYGQYFLLLELLATQFDGEDYLIEVHLRQIQSKLGIRFGAKCTRLLQKFTALSLIEFELEEKVYKISAPILLDLQGKDFKYSRRQREQSEPKNKNKNKKENKNKNNILSASKKPKSPPGKTVPTFEAYSTAYRERYGVEPVRNATVNGQLSKFVDRVGAEDAPKVAKFFVELNDSWYSTKGHSVGAMLNDAEKLRTQWATGKKHNTQTSKLPGKATRDLTDREILGDLYVEPESEKMRAEP